MKPSTTVSPLALLEQLRGQTGDYLVDETITEDLTAGAIGAVLALGLHLSNLDAQDGARVQLLETILHTVQGERAFLIRHRPSSEDWQVLESRNFEGEEILNGEEKIITSLVDPCREREHGYLTLDLAAEPVYESLKRQREPRTHSLLIMPFPEPETLLYVDHRFRALALNEQVFLEFAWLFTLLVSTERVQHLAGVIQALEDDLREQRRETKVAKKRGFRSVTVDEQLPSADSRGLAGDFRDIVGNHADVVEILELIEKVAPTSAPILINGESGTGKELVAKAIHRNSDRSDAPFVSENCAALAENLLEAELFGSMKGAYTGAHEDRPGLFELADGGTLFLDEIGDTSPGLQKKLLRVLQEGMIRRVGGAKPIQVNVRVCSATNKDLFAEVQAGNFREDLFYRLNVINIALPPLRDRREDVPLLVEHFVADLNASAGAEKESTSKLISALMAYDWPGNIRELQNEIRRVFALGGKYLKPEDLSPRIVNGRTPKEAGVSVEAVLDCGSLKEATEHWERQILEASLRRFNGNKARLCDALKIPKTTLYAKLRRYGLIGDTSD